MNIGSKKAHCRSIGSFKAPGMNIGSFKAPCMKTGVKISSSKIPGKYIGSS